VTESLEASHTVERAVAQVHGSSLHAWPVVANQRLVGMVSLAALEEALADGKGAETLSTFADSGEFPHLHADHPLSLALERMGATHHDVLPVVNRADVHKLEGIVTLQDVLCVYGLSESRGSS